MYVSCTLEQETFPCGQYLRIVGNVFLSCKILTGNSTQMWTYYCQKQKRSTEGCSKFKSPEIRQVQERLVSTLEHMQVPKWDRTRCPEE